MNSYSTCHRQAFIILLSLLSGYCLKAQSTKQNQRTFFALIVEDRNASINWYSEHLKLDLLDSTSFPERKLFTANMVNDYFHIELIEIQESTAIAKDQRYVRGIFKVGATVSNFDELYGHLKSKSANFRSDVFYDDLTKLRSFIVLDLDENRLQFFGR